MMADITNTCKQEETRVKRLLEECGLPSRDLSAEHMDDFLSLYDGDRLVGCVGLEIFGEYGLLRSLAVQAEYRGRGKGARLLTAAEARATSRGVRILYLLTTTAEAFFTARGYIITGRSIAPEVIQQTSEFRSLCPSSAVCMNKPLLTLQSHNVSRET
jgi:amino-acid N-acetyltransferase